MDSPFEALVAITAIVVGCWMLVQVARYGARAARSIFGTSAVEDSEGTSLTQGEVETMIRRAVREEVRQEVRPLQEKIDRLEQRTPLKEPRRDLPEDPHDFGLIADEPDAREGQVT